MSESTNAESLAQSDSQSSRELRRINTGAVVAVVMLALVAASFWLGRVTAPEAMTNVTSESIAPTEVSAEALVEEALVLPTTLA